MFLDSINTKGSLDIIKKFVQEDPSTYFICTLLAVLIGLLEFLGISSLLPALGIMLGEDVPMAPSMVKEYVKEFGNIGFGIAFSALIIFQSIISGWRESYFVSQMSKWRTNLTLEYLKNISQSNWEDFNSVKPGEIEVMITRNIGISMKSRHMTCNFLCEVVLSFIYIGLAVYISLYTSILFFVLAVVFGLIQKVAVNKRVQYAIKANEMYVKVARKVIELFSDKRSFLLGDDKFFYDELFVSLDEASVAQKKNDQFNIFFKNIHQPVVMSVMIVSAFFAHEYLKYSASTILGILYVFYRAAPKIISVGRGFGDIIVGLPVDVAPLIREWKKKGIVSKKDSPSNYSIEFQNAELGYRGANTSVLKDINISIKEGDFVCFSGKSGSGKTTIIDAICGFSSIYGGDISLGGVSISNIDWSEWRSQIGLVRPDGIVVSGNWIENVAFLDSQPNEDIVKDVISKVGLMDLVNENRDGLQASISSKGGNLSTGQKQRLLIARALYRKSKILVLDEPTSNLDQKTEDDINKLILSLKGKHTIIVISHRDSILNFADRVYRVEGRQVTV